MHKITMYSSILCSLQARFNYFLISYKWVQFITSFSWQVWSLHFMTISFEGFPAPSLYKKNLNKSLINSQKRNAYYRTCRICGFQLKTLFLSIPNTPSSQPPSCSLALLLNCGWFRVEERYSYEENRDEKLKFNSVAFFSISKK